MKSVHFTNSVITSLELRPLNVRISGILIWIELILALRIWQQNSGNFAKDFRTSGLTSFFKQLEPLLTFCELTKFCSQSAPASPKQAATRLFPDCWPLTSAGGFQGYIQYSICSRSRAYWWKLENRPTKETLMVISTTDHLIEERMSMKSCFFNCRKHDARRSWSC